ncbi:MAG: phenylalanine--tRNA ligase subunit alpha [Bacteroidota bacterium]|jgi:phenylalanyl-tRNA synthetase alpha chain|nr:phenylalanine--tRNA ligase subunit alpha [Bacteroidota bacterium]
MKEKIDALLEEMRRVAAGLESEQAAEQFRIMYLSRKGTIAQLFEQLKDVAPEIKPRMGKALNGLRQEGQSLLDAALAALVTTRDATHDTIDLTLPGRTHARGHMHIVSQTVEEISDIFRRMGFSVADGPEIETEYYNFEALNFAADHPARDMQDTFFITDNHLLRTHTTPVQVRLMEQYRPPIRAIFPGKVYRNEVISARSHVQFHQIDGLFVDRGVTFADLKGTLVTFARMYYGSSLKYRFRPSYFPFTEPSAEMDISCYLCHGTGCRVCKQSGWLEILGCGMVDPNVFSFVDVDPEEYSGYAFGIGIERTAMLRHGIDDIRLLFENDLRVNHQFN